MMTLSPACNEVNVIRRISHTETYPLRQLVLRPGLPVSSCMLPKDESDDCIHLGLFTQNSTSPQGIVSIHPETFPDRPSQNPEDSDKASWRIRAMAVHPDSQKKGFGYKLIQQSLCEIKNQGGTKAWCNARSHATNFYLKCGFEISGPEFNIEGIGPHFRMFRSLNKP